MEVVFAGEGRTEVYMLHDTVLVFRGDQLKLDLAMLQREYPLHIDICEDENGKLTTEVTERYVAQLDIPPRAFRLEIGPEDDFGFPIMEKVWQPLDLNAVRLTLWPLED